MKEPDIKYFCATYFKSRKGYTIEIDDFSENETGIEFKITVLKNSGYKAHEYVSLSKSSDLTLSSQLNSRMEKFSAHVINHLR